MPPLRIPPGATPAPMTPATPGAASKAVPPARSLPYSEHLQDIRHGDGSARARMLDSLSRHPGPGPAPAAPGSPGHR